MKLYKLTDQNGFSGTNTINATALQWGENVTHSTLGEGDKLCKSGLIHAYEHPLVAVLMNPIHANFNNPKLWLAQGDVVFRQGDIKCGCKTLTTIKEIPLPIISYSQKVRILREIEKLSLTYRTITALMLNSPFIEGYVDFDAQVASICADFGNIIPIVESVMSIDVTV